ncbi:hypothetical protein EGI22_20455 [Lacihabitans sp. LS3-19]|uniref:hypothetical protein n=1 Tax=Lacihabitans sp. LS3-19 TaxID=2487335 RepID=UPI0020CF30D8|nr:hypothetical protein [Lacihabitans sp. LS3-19]MCP9770284.1 hypothetical protein [Lacihabitans sp. LS3-19]
MNFIKEINRRNAPMAYVGTFFLVLSIMLGVYATVNTQEILGINAMIKPLKFALSLWILAWTMAYLLYYVNDQKKVEKYSVLAIITMVYEQAVITIQAFRGKLSHFNQTEIVGGILYALMGIMIVWLTTATLILTIRFIRQKTYAISSSFAFSIKIGLIMFVAFSFFGGYMSAINSHNVGGEIGGKGLSLLNWSTVFGDLRVAHFFGIHSLQIIPFLGYFISKNYGEDAKAKRLIWFSSLIYLAFVCFTMFQALAAMPFLKI